jgi:prevent-host-death family protein
MVMKRIAPKPRQKISRARESAAVYEVEPAQAHGVTREIGAGEFKARCLAIMDEVHETGSEYIITKRGVPVAKLVPARIERRPLLGSMKGSVTTRGDIVSPLDEPWDALEELGRER